MAKQKPKSDAYAKERQSQAAIMRAKRTAGRDIGEIPAVADPARRDECERSFRRFCEVYFAATFSLEWSPDHLRVLAQTERAVLFGDLFAMAMPRGSGKTSIVVAACLWALLTGEHEFVALIAADEGASSELLESIKTELETNDLLAGDFPEACYPIRCLEGIPQRRLLYKGESVRMEFTAKMIVLPNIPGSPSFEAAVKTCGITGRIRGMLYKRSDGRSQRPSLVVIDDPQTDESAGSVTQCATREKILSGAILGLAGPGKKISGIMPCTVIRPGDMADKILDASKYPQWNGERTKLVYSWPTNAELLREYTDLRAECQRRKDPAEVYNAFWRERQAAIEAGAVIAWTDRKGPDDISAIQHAVNLRMDVGPAAFQAEYQNDPIDDTATSALLGRDQIARKVSGYERGKIPSEAAHLSAFIDVQGKLLWWAIIAWRGDFTGYVVDYGAWPAQRRSYYTLADASPTIADQCPGGLEASLFTALGKLTTTILGREWEVDGGGSMKIGRCLIDANWGESTSTVYSFCRQSPYASIILPTHGRGVKASGAPILMWPRQDGEQTGLNWRIRRTTQKHAPIRHGIYDTNYWKSFLHSRLLVPAGGKGSLTLFKSEPQFHEMLADHLHAEYPTLVESQGRKVSEWQDRPSHPDNHFLDCLTGCCVGASILGAMLETDRRASQKPRKPLKEMGKRS